ncbi:MAG: hypothetical protein DHS20C19_29070 [Acidimicrobiales bacterium]|nr:MAG: hypothetical protein DHS20C19_29070 [Acidimicrobiales bacterium]
MRFFAALTISLSILAGPAQAPPDALGERATLPLVAPVSAPAVTVIGGNDRQLEVLDDSLKAFASFGLDLPPVTVTFSDSEEPCRGNAGYYVPRSKQVKDGVDEIYICTMIRSVVLHELAHAWDRHFGEAERRQAFLERWGLERWSDPADDWYERGSERSAETIAFALALREPTDNPDMLRYVCGFETITGVAAPAAVQASDCA